MEKVSFFSADYRDGRVRIGNKTYPAGYYAEHLLNQYYKDDTAARIAVFKLDNWVLQDTLDAGFVSVNDFLRAGNEIQHIFDALPRLKPFDMLDIEAERNRVQKLFSEDNANRLIDYFHRKAAVMAMDDIQAMGHTMPKEYDKQLFAEAEALLQDIRKTLRFYDELSNDMRKAYTKLKAFVSRADDADRLDEAHLLPIAMDIFGEQTFSVNAEYVPYKKTAKSTAPVVARRFYFDRYYSFILTDFFEGLHHGYYPRRCEICGSYFLMTSARRQRYCSGLSPYEFRGKRIPCRKYAASINRKELAAADPVVDIYNRRCSAIRVEKSRGTIPADFAEKAKALALEHKLRAQQDAAYAAEQYAQDMQRDKLYNDAKMK